MADQSITADQHVPFTVSVKDKAGNPTSPTGVVTVSQSTPATDTLTVAADGLSGDCAAAAVGTDTLTATDSGSGVSSPPSVLTVTPGAPAALSIDFGAPVAK
jgi:hypothetical protein